MQNPRSAPTSEALLEVRPTTGNGVVVLKAEGELDLSTAGHLHDPLLRSIAEGGPVLVDLTRVSFIDSSGIAALVGAFRSINGGGGMSVLIAPDSQVARVFKVARMGQALPIFTDRTKALSGLNGTGAVP